MKYLVTGGAGFIGSHIVDQLMASDSNEVIVYDNLSNGNYEFIQKYIQKKSFKFLQADLLDLETLREVMKDVDIVFHLAANSDIRYGLKKRDHDLKQGIIVTFNILDSMVENNIKNLIFASSSAVFGNPIEIPTSEHYPNTLPISLYGASKLSAEALISSFVHCYGIRAWIFRFANIVGPRGTHGVIYDLINKLKKDPTSLEVLGDGSQAKDYLYVEDCIDGMLYFFEKLNQPINIINLGTGNVISVSEIVKILLEEVGLNGSIVHYTGGKEGWRGDVSTMTLDTTKSEQFNWKPQFSSSEVIIRKTVKKLVLELGVV